MDGICLILLDADMASLIQAFVRRRKLKPRGVEILRPNLIDLRRILPSLTGEAADYFGELARLAAATLRFFDDPGR